MLGTRTPGGRMEGADESTELWRRFHPNTILPQILVTRPYPIRCPLFNPCFLMGKPWPLLSFIFSLFNQTSWQFLQQIYVKNGPSSIRCWDLNTRPSDYESSQITTRPGLVFTHAKRWTIVFKLYLTYLWQSYKSFTILIYESRVVLTLN